MYMKQICHVLASQIHNFCFHDVIQTQMPMRTHTYKHIHTHIHSAVTYSAVPNLHKCVMDAALVTRKTRALTLYEKHKMLATVQQINILTIIPPNKNYAHAAKCRTLNVEI